MNNTANVEVLIIGGSYAGLSAAMALGRSLRKVLIIDSGLPCNRQTPHTHNLIAYDGMKPGVILAEAKAQVLQYNTVSFLDDRAIEAEKIKDNFHVLTQSGKEFIAKKVIFATGITDLMPAIKGFSACWGISVVHCPYCHGYEIRGKKTGIIANGDRAMHMASLVNNLTDKLTMLTSGKSQFTQVQQQQLEKHAIDIIEKEIVEIEHKNGFIERVVFKDGSKEDFAATYAMLPFIQHSEIPQSLGCELTEEGYIRVDMMQKTTLEGVFAVGDNCTGMRSVAMAIASGNKAGAVVNMELTHESF